MLLYFWSAASPVCQQDLTQFEQSYARWTKEGLQLIAVNADDIPSADEGSALTPYRHLPFPILASAPDLVAIYNILYRSLFDRHRDLSLPTSFLLDETGAIVKIYQGPARQEQIEEDFRHIPRTASERMAKALPFPGVSETTEFGRNYLSYGSVFFERGYMEQAEHFFRLALRDDPSGAEALYGLGSVYLQQQKSARSARKFRARRAASSSLSRHPAKRLEQFRASGGARGSHRRGHSGFSASSHDGPRSPDCLAKSRQRLPPG